MLDIFAPKSDSYAEIPLLEGEQIIRQQTASVGSRSIWGGQLVLTNQRLLFRPLNMGGMTKLINDGIAFLPNNLGVLGKLVKKALDYTTAYQDGLPGAVPTTAISSVRAGQNAALTHPPSLVLLIDNGTQVEFGILKSILTLNVAPANRVARDEMVDLISLQMAAGGLP